MKVSTPSEYGKFLQDFAADKSPLCALDVETEPFTKELRKPWQLPLLGVGLCTGARSWYVRAEALDERFQEVLTAKVLLMHNGKFDLSVLGERYDISAVSWRDTLVLAWLVNENRPALGLKKLAVSELGHPESEVTKFKDIPKPKVEGTLFEFMSAGLTEKWLDDIGSYCEQDCKWTYDLYKKLMAELEKSPQLVRVYETLLMPVASEIRQMERRGIAVDVQTLKNLQNTLHMEIKGLRAALSMECGEGINFDSPVQLRTLFAQKYGFEATGTTETGLASVDANAIRDLLKKHPDHPFLTALLRYRECQKFLATYAVGLAESAISGVIHTSFNQCGTATGRFSSSEPNLQNVPASKGKEFDVRGCFMPRKDHVFIVADYSQVELRIMAHYTQAKALVQAYQEGKDIHQATADLMGCTRTVAKTINFGLNYGRTAKGMAEALGMEVAECQAFVDTYFRNLPEVKAFMDSVPGKLLRDGCVTTITGRPRRFPEYAKARSDGERGLCARMERQATNAMIQGSAADIIAIAMRNLGPGLKKHSAHMLMQIHDELVIECPMSSAKECEAYVKEAMESCVKLKNVPLIAAVSSGLKWEK